MSTLSGILFFVAFLPYIWAIIHGETSPSPVSWAIWASVDTITFFAMKKVGAKLGQIGGALAGAWIVTLLAIWFGKPTMGSIEWVSIAGAVTALVLWAYSGAALAIVSTQVALFVAAFPTFSNAYHNPAQENPVAWTIWFASCVCMLLAVRKWDIANALQPITFTVIEVIVFALVVVRPLF